MQISPDWPPTKRDDANRIPPTGKRETSPSGAAGTGQACARTAPADACSEFGGPVLTSPRRISGYIRPNPTGFRGTPRAVPIARIKGMIHYPDSSFLVGQRVLSRPALTEEIRPDPTKSDRSKIASFYLGGSALAGFESPPTAPDEKCSGKKRDISSLQRKSDQIRPNPTAP